MGILALCTHVVELKRKYMKMQKLSTDKSEAFTNIV